MTIDEFDGPGPGGAGRPPNCFRNVPLHAGTSPIYPAQTGSTILPRPVWGGEVFDISSYSAAAALVRRAARLEKVKPKKALTPDITMITTAIAGNSGAFSSTIMLHN